MLLLNRFKCLSIGLACLLFFTSIYSKDFLIPAHIIESFRAPYSSEEMLLVEKDLSNIKRLCFDAYAGNNKELIYVATAGGPGASKSTILENWLFNKKNFAYLDPDQRALKFMIHTYLQELTYYKVSKANSYKELLEDAYTKWRGASNYIANFLLDEAFINGYNIAHGTTSTAKVIYKLYENLKKKKYKIKLLLCGSSDENRANAINHRLKEQGFWQQTLLDTVEKGKMFYDNFPIYFKYADEIHLFWTANFLEGSPEVAIYKKDVGLKVIDQKAMDKFKKGYEDRRQEVGSNLPVFDDLVSVK